MGNRSVWFGVLGLVALGCTSDFDSFEFEGAGGSAAGGSSGSGGGQTGGNAGAAPGGTGGSTGGAAGTAVGGSGGATGGAGGATGGTGGSTGGTGGTTDMGFVTCESENSCNLSSGYCCVSNDDFECHTTNNGCNPGTDVHCDGPEDCSGNEVCCAQVNGSFTFVTELECRPQSQCQQFQGRYIACGSSPNVCPNGTTCGPGTLIQKYQFCIP